MSRSRQIRIGVVGFGEWGPNHVRVFSNLPDSKVVGIVDPRAERLKAARQQFGRIRTFQNHKELMDTLPLDAMVVATPTCTHGKIVKDALKAGIHVLCEKPLCVNLREGEDLVQLATAKKLILMVGHVFLFNAGILKLRQILQEKDLGVIHYLACRRTNLGPIRTDVNAVWDLASHDVSIINYLLNTLPLRVSATGQAYLRHRVQDIAFVTLTYPGDILAHLHISWLDPVKVREITAVGNRKMAIWDDLSLLGPIRIYDKWVIKEQHYTDFGHFQLLTKEGDVTIPRISMEEPLLVQARHFLASIREEVKCLSDGKFALDVVRVLAAINGSMSADGTPVTMNR